MHVIISCVHFAGTLLSWILQLFADKTALGSEHSSTDSQKEEKRPFIDVTSVKPPRVTPAPPVVSHSTVASVI